MTFLQRTASRRGAALVEFVRWMGSAPRFSIEEPEDAQALLETRRRTRYMTPKVIKRRKPPVVEEPESAPVQSQPPPRKEFYIPETFIAPEQIRPDFRSTALAQVLSGLGIEGVEFDRFAERNPRAFHATHAELHDWIYSVRGSLLGLRDQDLRQMLIQHPRVLLIPAAQIDRIVNFLDQKLKLQANELKRIAVGNPSIFEKGFEERFYKAADILYERFKILFNDLKDIAVTYPRFLSLLSEDRLLRLAALFAARARMNPNQVGRLLKECPQLLSQSIFDLHEQLIFFGHYTFQEQDIRQMLMECPSVLDTKSPADLRHIVNYLEATLTIDKHMVKKILFAEPSIFRLNTDTQIAPNLAALRNLGFDRHKTALIIVRCPRILKSTLYDSQTEVKLQFLREELDKDAASLVTYPGYLTFSMPDHILMRVSFMKSVRRTDYKDWPLMKLFGDTDEEFCTRHVKTAPEKYIVFKEAALQHPSYIKLMTKWAPELRTASA